VKFFSKLPKTYKNQELKGPHELSSRKPLPAAKPTRFDDMWDQLEPTPSHLTYLFLAAFLLTYALFSQFIRNVLHLSEPPLAVLVGIILGPVALRLLVPQLWGWDDVVVQEVTRVIVGIQCFAVGIELPKFYFARHWKSVAMMLGPVMAVGSVFSKKF